MEPQNNIAGNGSFDKIFLKNVKIHNEVFLNNKLGRIFLQFPAFQVWLLFQNTFMVAKWAYCLPSPSAELSLQHFAADFKPEIDDFFRAESRE